MDYKKNFKFSIITPSFNRSKLLHRTWLSIKNQSEYLSEWIVIDDGSNDQTFDLISRLKKESCFKIVYEYNINKGMTHAINIGFKYVTGDYFFKLDSDDYLLDNALEIIYQKINEIIDSELYKEVNAYSFLTCKPNGKIINKFNNLKKNSNYVEEKIITLDYLSARYRNLITGDLLDIFRSYPLLNHFRYPVFNDERHSPSSFISYFNADYLQGKVAYVLESVLVKDYQSEGISSTRRKYGLNVPNKSLKSYLVSYLWLLSISSNKVRPLFSVLKITLKTYSVLLCKLITRSLKLVSIKFIKFFLR